MLFSIFFLALAAVGCAASIRLWEWGGAPDDSPGRFEAASSAGLLSLGLAVAISWSLALFHVLGRWTLLGAALAVFTLAWPTLARLRTRFTTQFVPTRGHALVVLAVAPAALWVAYIVVRGTVVFPFPHDALAYHLPKALFIARAHGYAFFDAPELRLSTFPANYELLLADVITLDGTDTLTGVVGVLAYLLFGATVAGLTERWWGKGTLHVVATTMLSLAMPTVLLGSGAHKNDVLLAACIVAAAHFAARWAVRGERAALLLAMIAACLAAGTKVNGLVLVGALAPLGLWRIRAGWRRANARASRTAIWLGAGLLLFFALGGIAYAYNFVHLGRPLVASKPNGYGDWRNLWMFPYLAFARPLSSNGASWVPWKHAYWFWPQWDLHFSTYGLQSTLALLAMPFALARYRKAGQATERALASLASALAWFAMLPVSVENAPVGFFEGIVRYTLFFPPILLAWTVAPAIKELAESARGRTLAGWGVAGSSAVYLYMAVNAAIGDTYAPFSFVAAAFVDPKYSRTSVTWTVRAASWVDANAAPEDSIAFDGAFDSWIYPAYGADLGRKVVFLHSEQGEPVVIPPNVKWVAIDRSWSCVFGHPKFVDFSLASWGRYILRGKPLPEDLIVYRQLVADPAFRLVYRDEKANQAVFARIDH